MIKLDLKSKLGTTRFNKFITEYNKLVTEFSYGFYYPNKDNGKLIKGNLEKRINGLSKLDTSFAIDFSKLKNIVQTITSKYFDINNYLIISPEDIYQLSKLDFSPENGFGHEFKKQLHKVFDYDKLSKKLQMHFRQVDWGVCYYCNRNYILNFEHRISQKHIIKRVSFQLDHFYPKNTNRHLALSFYNFVPSCSFCNVTLKKDKAMTSIPPTHPHFDFHEQYKFVPILNTLDLMGDRTLYNDYINTFQLESLYREHKDILTDLRNKMNEYPITWLKELEKYPLLYKSNILKDIYNTTFDEVDFDKHPLSKLRKDLGDNLGINDDI